jgi:uncharacterized membrane protein (UPF0127 family)
MRLDLTVTIYREGGQCLLPKVRIAERFGTRWRGLMFYRQMPEIDGLLLYPCNSVHMFWMRFALSLVYLDRNGQILRVVEKIAPNQIGPIVKDAYYVLETYPDLPSQMKLAYGERLRW